MAEETRNSFVRQLIGASVFAALALVSVVMFLTIFAPKPRLEPLPAFRDYDRQAMHQAVAPEPVKGELETILGFGSRFIGQKGFYETEQYLRRAMQQAGLEVLEQKVQSVAPRTLERRIVLAEDGSELPGVQIYPFFPNHFQPMVTPKEGITGRLLVVNNDVLLKQSSFEDCIALVDTADPPDNFGSSWVKYAQVGFKAVIVTNSEGMEALDWKSMVNGGMVSSVPVNFVRLAANEKILSHAGKTVRLHVRTEYYNTDNTTLIGVLRAGEPANEALVVASEYDATSVLPDLAPGALPAVSVATQMALLKGIQSYQPKLKRDVVFVCSGSQMMSHDAMGRLLATLGHPMELENTLLRLQEEQNENEAALRKVEVISQCVAQAGFLTDGEQTRQASANLDSEQRAFLEEQLRYVLNTVVLERSEEQLGSRVAFIRTGGQDTRGPLFKAFIAAKAKYDQALTAAGYPMAKLVATQQALLEEAAVRDRCRQRFQELSKFHSTRAAQAKTDIQIHQLFGRYRRIICLAPNLAPADPEKTKSETLSFYMGDQVENNNFVQHPVINNLLMTVVQDAKLGDKLKYDPLQAKHSGWANPKVAGLPVLTKYWNTMSYPAFAIVNTDRTESYQLFGFPVEKPFMRNLETIRNSLQVTGDAVLSLAFGDGTFLPPTKTRRYSFSGRVYAANVGQSIVPNYPVAGALFGSKLLGGGMNKAGYFTHVMLFTDPYGRYTLPDSVADVNANGTTYSPNAVWYGPGGLIRLVKDEGPQGQAVYKSMDLNLWIQNTTNVNIVVFRAAGVSILDLVNPQTLKAYAGVEFITRDGLSPFIRVNSCAVEDINTTFIEPDRYFYAKLRAGSAENPLVQSTRAFILGVGEPGYTPDPSKEIDGRGYLAYDTPLILDVPRKVAESMSWVNGNRLALQDREGMADERTNAFQAKVGELLKASGAADLAKHQQVLLSRDAVTYATLNHPVLRDSIFEAVVGILWYLGLLVPFVFFFEKLVFGYTDIRKQLAAEAVIFLVVFVLLRMLHPAFEMIRSSLMILLGFVILLIAGGITAIFSGKFQENLEELRKQRGKVAAAEVNTMGVIGTAFMLGLNNMHRRRVRTGLTCATLVLITFAMICFTSIQSNLVDTATAMGKAPYQGFLVKGEQYYPVTGGELFALQTKFGHEHKVAARYMWVGERTWEQQQFNPEFEIIHEPKGGASTKVLFDSTLIFSDEEPLQDRIKLVAGKGWFTKEQTKTSEAPPPVIIPDTMARKLGISAESVNQGGPTVKINGKPCLVYGIFDAAAFGLLRDLDGRPLLPFDVEGMVNVRMSAALDVLATETDPLLGPDVVVLAARDPGASVPHGSKSTARMVSVAVSLDSLAYKPAKAIIDQFLEQGGQSVYYGLDGVAYLGKRAHASAALRDCWSLLIPLIIAALTVLNTMRGSVYASVRTRSSSTTPWASPPRYVFFMFFAEAFVYAVVGFRLGIHPQPGNGAVVDHAGVDRWAV